MNRFPLLDAVLLLFWFCVSTCPAHPLPDYVWVEGEAPTSANVKWTAAATSHPDWLSGGKWLTFAMEEGNVEKEMPADGALFEYALPVAFDAKYELWARLGFEFARSTFEWKLDDGQWTAVTHDQLTSDAMELDFFTEAAWLKLADVQVSKGGHKLTFRIPKAKNKIGKYERVLFGLDCVCLSANPFYPYSRYKPDETGRTERDEAAAKQVFDIPRHRAGQIEVVGRGDDVIFGKEAGREEVSLAGLWEICRADEQIPGEVAEPMQGFPDHPRWSAITVPGDRNALRPDLLFAHRLWYRTRVMVPREEYDKSYFLVFPQNNLNTTVYVNGIYCGFDKNPLARVQIDVTRGIKPGQVNEIWVGIRDAWYGRSRDPGDPMKLRRTFSLPASFFQQGFQELAYPVWNQAQSGILVAPTLVAAGRVYASDVFVKPSVAKKQLSVEVTVVNSTARDVTGTILLEASEDSLSQGALLKGEPFTVSAGQQKMINVIRDFPNARLWWPDQPQLYLLRTRLIVDNTITDRAHTPFGFREWTLDGIHFKLNGVPFHGWCDQHSKGGNPQEWLAFQRKTNQRMMRLWGNKWMGLTPDEALDFFDKNGVVVRRSGALDGEAIGYHADEPDANLRKISANPKIKMDLMQNWRDQICAQVKGERNHPSIMIWSIENEWLFINCINLYGNLMDDFEAEETKTAQAVQKVDPTRPLMSDGGAACKAQTLPVCGNHYIVGPMNEYPALAYAPNVKGGGRGRWEWDQKRPRFLGEDWYITGNHLELAYIGGEAALTGKAGSLPAAGLMTRILQEGYRWADYGAWDFWMNDSDADGSQYIAFAPRAVLCREWNWTFGSGERATRTFAIFNDTHSDDPIFVTWSVNVGAGEVAAQTKEYHIAAGTREIVDVVLPMPHVSQREEGALVLKLVVNDKQVFTDTKPISVLPVSVNPDRANPNALEIGQFNSTHIYHADPNGKPKVGIQSWPSLPMLKATDLFVFDPAGRATSLLKEHGIAFTALGDLKSLPFSGKILLIGKDALDKSQRTSAQFAAWAAAGRTVIVLEQEHPLEYQAIPAEMAPAINIGRTAFIEDPDHPALRGLQSRDFFTWGDDEIVYKNAYAKPSRGGRSLIECGEMLKNSALVEVPVEKGLMLLCQLSLEEKLPANATAQVLLLNLLNYAADYKLTFRPATVTASLDSPLSHVVDDIGLTYAPAADPVAAIAQPGERIAVVEATPENLASLAAHVDQVAAFTQAGGWIVFNNLTPPGLASYNKIVGWEHVIRPFKRERVTLSPIRSSLTAGIPAGDVTMYSSKRVFAWQEGNFTVSDEFNFVIDYDEVAPFGKSSFYAYDNIVNGFTAADGWPLIINFAINKDGSPFNVPIAFPKKEIFTEFTWIGNTNYWYQTKVNLIFDGEKKQTMQSFDVQPNGEPQTFAIDPPRPADKVTLQIAGWQERAGIQPLIGIDNIYLKVRRSPEFYKNVRPMLNIGGMMEYPRGKGGIVLCNLLFKESEEVPVNAHKKRAIFSAILRNLKGQFSAAKGVIVGSNLSYHPIDISKQANQYRTERGWFGDKRFTFADMPTGKQVFGGVPYEIFDFATSPVPTAIMLGGVGVPNDLGKSVSGIPVHRKADALFFLQAARLDHRRTPRALKDGEKWEMARYVVHYADGKTVIVPLYSEIDLENYRQAEPKPLPGAQVAWSHKYEGTAFYAVAYSKQWNNPRPQVEIATIDLVYGPDRAGVPALLALTAASAN